MRRELSKRTEEILNFIVDYTKKNGYSPTISEIKNGITNNKSFSLVQYAIKQLEDKGYIKRVTERKPIAVLKEYKGGGKQC